ncbi:MAG: hypothetical protein N4A72_17350 [Bacteroidales bacterium]|jgi:hypothetical protein|nr:hypothetical protein [Bacteroidales bacterium]
MLVKYTNRKGEIHYLKAVLTSKGSTRYYIVKNKKNVNQNELLTEFPEGFEFYEYPEDGKVSLRKKQSSIFNEEEKNIVSKVLNKQNDPEDYIIDLEKDAMLIYIAHLKKDDFGSDLEIFRKIQSFNVKLRVVKNNKDYQIQRFCHLMNNYGWITLETSTNLEKLCEKYCPHIDKDSLLEFWIEGEKDW